MLRIRASCDFVPLYNGSWSQKYHHFHPHFITSKAEKQGPLSAELSVSLEYYCSDFGKAETKQRLGRGEHGTREIH